MILSRPQNSAVSLFSLVLTPRASMQRPRNLGLSPPEARRAQRRSQCALGRAAARPEGRGPRGARGAGEAAGRCRRAAEGRNICTWPREQ